MVSKIVYFSLPAHGHINATVPVMRELVRRGVSVHYYALERFRTRVEKTGAVFHDYGPRFSLPERGPGPFASLDTVIDALIDLTRVVLQDHLDSVRSLDPSCIMHDSFSPWGTYLAQALNLPEIASVSSIIVNERIALGGTGAPDLWEAGQQLINKFPGWASALASLKKEFGVAGIPSPYMLMQAFAGLNLVYTSRAFQPGADEFSEERFKFVGQTVSSHVDGPPFPFETLDGRPLLYVALGTLFQGRGSFLRNCIEAFRNSPWQVVMAAGEDLNSEDLNSLPENFVVRPSVPQPDILKRAAIFITHGGTNSVSEALWYGVPMLVSPGGGDQFWIADRVAELGAGQNLAGLEVNAEILRERVEQIASQPSYAAAAAKLGESLRAAGGAQRAVDEIGAFVMRTAGGVGSAGI
jgi:MGT family glycosyltransferase